MGESEGLGPVPTDRRAVEEGEGVASRSPDDARVDRLTAGRHPEERMSLDAAHPLEVVPPEPLAEGGPYLGPIRGATGDGHDGPAKSVMEPVDVDDVESADHDAIEQDGAQVGEVSGRFNQHRDPFGGVAAVDLHAPQADRLHVAGERHHDRRERGATVAPSEPTVVHGDESHVRLRERST